MTTRKAVFVHSPELEKYSYPASCPFNTSRAGKVRKIISSLGLLEGGNRYQVAPEPAEISVLEKFHSARYLGALKAAAAGELNVESLHMGIGTPDCPVFGDVYDCGVWACGATMTGVNMILSGEAELAFNPSGGLHHAGPELASGFCYINDVAIACLSFAEAGKRVFYLDVDVHHGDGVANAFYDRADVMTVSFHQSGRCLFPGTGFENEIGIGKGEGYCVNVPLPIGTYDQVYMEAFREIALPLIEVYKPDVIVFELGADALAGDRLGQLQLTNNAYVDIIRHLLSFNKPILMTGGGGYNIDNTVRAWALAWSVLCSPDTEALRDRELIIDDQQCVAIAKEIKKTLETVKANIKAANTLAMDAYW